MQHFPAHGSVFWKHCRFGYENLELVNSIIRPIFVAWRKNGYTILIVRPAPFTQAGKVLLGHLPPQHNTAQEPDFSGSYNGWFSHMLCSRQQVTFNLYTRTTDSRESGNWGMLWMYIFAWDLGWTQIQTVSTNYRLLLRSSINLVEKFQKYEESPFEDWRTVNVADVGIVQVNSGSAV